MSFIESEIAYIQKICENDVPNSKIITCNAALPAFVRVNIRNAQKYQITIFLQFPTEYPKEAILIELKSRHLSSKFLEKLTSLSDSHARLHLSQQQGLVVINFINRYTIENPLCICFDEIQMLRQESDLELKLKQRNRMIQIVVKGGAYYYGVRAIIPDEYPDECVDLQTPETNLPAVLLRYLNGQSREIARQCVEAPIKLVDPSLFEKKPSLYRCLKFCLEATRDFHKELCPTCENLVLPVDPSKVTEDDKQDSFVERVYCGHIYHQVCLKRYLQEPPFPKEGKLCPAKRRHPRSDISNYLLKCSHNKTPSSSYVDINKTCNIRLAHDRWVINTKVAEARWSQKQARQRELDEVTDFFK